MKKILTIILLIISSTIYSQQTDAFDIIFKGEISKINNVNIKDVHDLIFEINKMMSQVKKETVIYDKELKPILVNKRPNEIDRILEQIKNNIEVEVTDEKNNSNLNITSNFSASNSGSLNLRNYPIDIKNSNVEIDKHSSINSQGIFDYSMNESIKEISGEINYKAKLLEKPKKLKLELVLNAFKKSDYKVLSKKDMNKKKNLNGTNFTLINLEKTFFALKIGDKSNVEIYPYQNGKIADFKGITSFSIWKPLYKYLVNTDDVTVEKISNKFSIDYLKKMNLKDAYVLFIPGNILDSEIIILKKEFQKSELSIEKEL